MFSERCHAFSVQYETGPFSFLFPTTPAFQRKPVKTIQKSKIQACMQLYRLEALEITRIWHLLYNVFAHGPVSWVMHFRIRKALKKITSLGCLHLNNSLGSLISERMNRRLTLRLEHNRTEQLTRMNTSEAL